MEYIQNIDLYESTRKTVVTLGKFDGVHRGHRKLISRVKKLSRANNWKAAVFTFSVSPQVCMGERKLRMLNTNDERYEILRELDMDLLIECPFTAEMQQMSAEDFVREILIKKLRAAWVVVGSDFRFGRNRVGDASFLQSRAADFGIGVDVIEKEVEAEREISSSYIREELQIGRMEQVNTLLGYSYFIRGEIVHGRHLGHSLGFPTINQVPDSEKMLPPNGVYFSVTSVGGKVYQGVSNIGVKPTVKGDALGIETYLFDCSEDLYGQTAKVELLHYRRPEMKFHSLEELTAHMDADIQAADDFFLNS